MKRTKFIAGALVLSMGLLGTGYAYWTDAISVSTTVDTGKLAVEMGSLTTKGKPQRNDKIIPPNGSTNTITDEQLTKTTISGALSADKKSAQFTLADLCPGYTAEAEMKIDNVGTMAAMLDKIKVTTDSISEGLKKELGMTVEVWNQTNWEPIIGETRIPIKVGELNMESIANVEENVNTWIKGHIDDQDRTLYVDAKGDMKVRITIGMATDAANNTQDESAASFGVEFAWTQYNAEMK